MTKDGKPISFEEVKDKMFIDVEMVLDYVASMSFWGVDDFVSGMTDADALQFFQLVENINVRVRE